LAYIASYGLHYPDTWKSVICMQCSALHAWNWTMHLGV
jgi:hypothetical protein